MKKYIFLFVMAVAIAAGCTKSGLIETSVSQSTPISFEPYLGKAPVTKAQNSDLDFLKTVISENLNSGGFQVYAFLHGADDAAPTTFNSTYMNEEVYWDSATSKWEYPGVVYWPEGAKLAFAAFGLNAINGGCLVAKTEGSETSKVKYTFTVKNNVSEQVDLIVAPYQTGLSTGDVNLNFKHLLSRVGFKVMSTDATEGVDIAIQSIKLVGSFPTEGEVDITALDETTKLPYITNTTGSQTEYALFENTDCFKIASTACNSKETAAPIYPNVTFTSTTGYTPKYTKEANETDEAYAARITAAQNKRYMMLMPCTMPTTGTEAYIEVKYQLTSDVLRTAKVELPSFVFTAGYAYEFILKVSTSAIVFDATMTTDWTNAGVPANPLPLSPEV